MSSKPIFVATHPRACSTAFERVFMTRHDLTCVHEPFGDAFYFGPERLSKRYEDDDQARKDSGFENSTYKTIFDNMEKEKEAGKRLFIKDIAHYLSPPHSQDASIAPSLGGIPKRGVGTATQSANGVNGALKNRTNGINGTKNTNSTSNGTSNGVANGIVNGIANGLTNGSTDAKAPFPYGTEAERGNPTVVPADILKKFHFTFLIRHPRSSIPSYYRCTIPPLNKITGFSEFYPSEAGYSELRQTFDFLKTIGQIGPKIAGEADSEQATNGEVTKSNGTNGTNGYTTSSVSDEQVSITLIDADDLLDNPNGIIAAYCEEVGLEYSDSMLRWDSEEDREFAKVQFEKWSGFHEDAIHSESLRPRDPAKKKKRKTKEQENDEWAEKFGEEAARVIRETVDANVEDYEYLKSFALKVSFKEPEQL